MVESSSGEAPVHRNADIDGAGVRSVGVDFAGKGLGHIRLPLNFAVNASDRIMATLHFAPGQCPDVRCDFRRDQGADQDTTPRAVLTALLALSGAWVVERCRWHGQTPSRAMR